MGNNLMGYKGISYIGVEITKNGEFLTKEEDLQDGDTFQVFNDVEWVAAGFYYCPYIPSEIVKDFGAALLKDKH